jgi:hypothetical protein
MCPVPPINYKNSQIENVMSQHITKPSPVGTTAMVLCNTDYQYNDASPLRVYECMQNLTWSENPGPENVCSGKLFDFYSFSHFSIHFLQPTEWFPLKMLSHYFAKLVHIILDIFLSVTCPVPQANYINSGPNTQKVSTESIVGTTLIHDCTTGTQFEDGSSTKIYTCSLNGQWDNLDPTDACKSRFLFEIDQIYSRNRIRAHRPGSEKMCSYLVFLK